MGRPEITFEEREPLALLGLDRAWAPDEPDDDPTSYGWARVPRIVLSDASGHERVIRDALVVAVHSADDEPDLPRSLMLEFWLEHEGEPVAVLQRLTEFLAERVQPLLGREDDVVLALCNPRAQRIDRPVWLGHRRLHVARGDVKAWLDEPTDGDAGLRLSADRWYVLTEAR